jgi:hypothetical protein
MRSGAVIEQERLMVYCRAEYPEYREWFKKVYQEANQTPSACAVEHDGGTGIMAAVEATREQNTGLCSYCL